MATKTVFVHARSMLPVSIPARLVQDLPRPIGVVTSMQFLHRVDDIVAQVGGVKVGQVLGCHTEPAEALGSRVGCFLFVGSGRFHPIGVAVKTMKPVYCFDPATGMLDRISDEEVQRFKARQQGALMGFLNANAVGVIVSAKSGQNLMSEAVAFKKACLDKEVFIFVCDTIDRNCLDNFMFIESWVNTACPRLPETDNPGMLNLKDVLEACPQYQPGISLTSPFLERVKQSQVAVRSQ